MLEYVAEAHGKTEASLTEAVKAKYDGDFPENWKLADTAAMRAALAKASVVKKKEWFKTVGHGEKLGQVIFKYFDEMKVTRLHQALNNLSEWID